MKRHRNRFNSQLPLEHSKEKYDKLKLNMKSLETNLKLAMISSNYIVIPAFFKITELTSK